MGGTCRTHGEMEKCTIFWFENLEVKRPLGRHRRKLKDNIRMDLMEIGFGFVVQDRDQWRTLVKTIKRSSGSIRGRGIF
jgi:hypothetical protein